MTGLNEKQMQEYDFHACFASFAQKMAKDGTPAIVINGFKEQMRRFFEGEGAFLGEGDITPVMDSEVPGMGDLKKYRAAGYAALSRTAIIKLNGGLGTSMGLEGPKSFLPVREGRTFLDLILNQVRSMREEFDAPLPLVLMNSFWTDGLTRKRLQDEINGDPYESMSFLQHRYPRIRRDNLAPLTMEGTPEQAYAFALQWLKGAQLESADLKQSRCNFCHIEHASQAVVIEIQRVGFSIIQMEGCPSPRK